MSHSFLKMREFGSGRETSENRPGIGISFNILFVFCALHQTLRVTEGARLRSISEGPFSSGCCNAIGEFVTRPRYGWSLITIPMCLISLCYPLPCPDLVHGADARECDTPISHRRQAAPACRRPRGK